MLVAIVAVQDEYSFTKKDSAEGYKLYRTKEENWDDVSDEITVENIPILRDLKV